MHPLLTLCARIAGDPTIYGQLAQAAHELSTWDCLATQAEAHGLAPLLYTHLQAAEISLPAPIKRELQGLYLRHRHANQVRAAVLVEILTAFQAAGLEVRVLKGAALAHLIYPQPGLRPMRDLDLLVKTSEVQRAQRLLASLGFVAPLPTHVSDKHLPAATRQSGGLSVSVELHHNLFNAAHPASLTLAQLTTPPLSFSVGGLTAHTLSREEMLWHLCEHAAYHTTVWESIRLIWVADVVGFAERFVAEIDWGRVKQQFPIIPSTLSLFHFITPLSATLQAQAGLNIGPDPLRAVQDFAGWPRTSVGQQRAGGKGYGRILADTFCPPEWWLRLHYRLDAVQSLFWHRWLIYPWHILAWVRRFLRQQVFNR